MNGPGDIPLTHSSTPDTRACSLISIIPALGMSSCRGRAEAFARSLSSKLRTLGSQTDDEVISPEDEPIINGGVSTNTWRTPNESEQTVTDLQPLRHESDSFFDFDCELESPGSPVDECEYLRLIETASNTPHNSAAESGYVCASASSSHSSNDGPYYDVVGTNESPAESQFQSQTQKQSQPPARNSSPVTEHCESASPTKVNGSTDRYYNGYEEHPGEEVELEAEAEAEKKMKTGAETKVEAKVEAKLETEVEADAKVAQNGEQKSNDIEESETAKANEVPTTGPDVGSEVTTLASTTSYASSVSSEMSSTALAEVQNHIIDELQHESEIKHEKEKSEEVESKTSEENGQVEAPAAEEQNNAAEEAVAPAQDKEEKEDQANLLGELRIEIPSLDKLAAMTEEEIEKEREMERESKITEEEKRRIEAMDDDEDDCRPQRIRRCSSLKTGKTPPGTPGRKKIVRFADVLGLDLADVKTFLDEIPTIPKSAFEDLEVLEAEAPIQLGPKSDKLLMPLFQQPGGLPNFLDFVREKQVSLENAVVTDALNQTITGSVRVRNLDFHKSVHIRYTLDNWRSFADLQANYVENSCDGFSDKFSFVLFGNTMQVGQRLEFAVRFQCKGQQFWDSNYGTNYCFQCLPSRSPTSNPLPPPVVPPHATNHMTGMLSPTVSDAWCSSFY